MKRRKFLQTASVVSVPLLLNGMKVGALPKSSFFPTINDSDRVLVLIQLNGGNDGLNTLIPLDQYSNLANARQNILIPENSVLQLEDGIGFHPVMTGMKALYDNAKMNIIQSVAYPNQNRSHFRSLDIWTSGSSAEEYLSTGWLGRYFNNLHPDFPEGYPNEACPDPFAITLGSIVSETCQGPATNFSMALTDPNNLTTIIEGEEGSLDLNTCYGYELNFLRTSIKQTNAYAETIETAAINGNNLAQYPDDNNLAAQLKIIAQLISGGLQTRVYVVNLGGFDTHAEQVADSTTTGIHAELLKTLSDAIAAFQEDLQLLGLDQRVVGMTFSEFGRQILSNDSLGTDHGTAAPLFVFGTCINAAIIGENPEIPEQVDNQEGVSMQYDFRSVYGSILMDWFEVSEADVKSLLYEDFQHIPIIQVCNTTSIFDSAAEATEIESYNFPNPFKDWTTIVFKTKNEWARISIYDVLGHEIKVLADQRFSAGEHKINCETRDLPAGNYYYRIITKDRQKTKGMIKSQT